MDVYYSVYGTVTVTMIEPGNHLAVTLIVSSHERD